MRFFIVLIGMPFLQMLTAYLFRLLVPTANSVPLTYCRIFLQQLVAVYIPVLLCFQNKKYFPKEEFSIAKPGYFLRCVWLGILLQFVGIAVNLPLTALLQHFGFSAPSSLSNAKSILEFLLQTAVVCLTPAVFEEVLFRRMVFGDLAKHSQKSAVFFSALFFAMAHFDFHNFAATLTIGLFLGMLRYRGAPLILCVTTHFFVNFTASVLNLVLELPVAASLFARYYLLIIFLAVIMIAISFPKKISSVDEVPTENALSIPKKHWAKLFLQPLFYIYLVIFFILGVNNL